MRKPRVRKQRVLVTCPRCDKPGYSSGFCKFCGHTASGPAEDYTKPGKAQYEDTEWPVGRTAPYRPKR